MRSLQLALVSDSMLRDDACAVRKPFTEEVRRLPCASAELGAAVRRASEFRDFCCRIFGWDEAQREAVDGVMHALLAAVAAGAAIALRGRSDLLSARSALLRLAPEESSCP